MTKQGEEDFMIYNDNDDFTINKLIVLYLLAEIKLPLTLSQITQIVLEKGYANYFSTQQYLNQLEESKLVKTKKENNSSYFEISETGRQTLDFFSSRIPYTIRAEIDEFINENWREIRNQLDVTAQYIPNREHEFIVNCKLVENNTPLMELNINVTTKQQAILMCNKWKENSSELYSNILRLMT